MTFVSNDPSWWPLINSSIFSNYWIVSACVVVVYDWVLTLGQEIELIWRQRWSLMTVLYLGIRYIGIPYSVANVLLTMTFASLTDAGCNITHSAIDGTYTVIIAMLCVIMIAQLHAMYQRSRMILIFLVIIFLVVNIACGVIVALLLKRTTEEEVILFGMHFCGYVDEGDDQLLMSMIWMLDIVWEVLALSLLIWIALKHFRDLRRLGSSTGSTIRGCFGVLIKSQVFYFASSICVFCIQFNSIFTYSDTTGVLILSGASEILLGVQMFVLGPRLILSVREYHAGLVAGSDAESSMESIVFQERVHIQTSSIV